jgi:lipopolysaccharide biosynthesis glycosyltransferase
MKKKNIAVVMSGTPNLAFAMANVLIGLNRHTPGFADECIIFTQKMSGADKDCLSKIANCRFVDYYGDEQIANLPETDNIGKYSVMSFAIYEIFKLLEEFEKVIYLDADLLIQRSVEGILDYGPISMGSGRLTISEACGAEIPDIDSTLMAKSSGVVIVNDSLPGFETMTQQCYELTSQYWHSLVFPDQAVINLVMAKRGIAISDLPLTYNTGKVHKNLHSATIVHTQGGKSKFWNNGVSNIMFPEWNRNNETWLSMGGAPYVGPRYYWQLHGISQVKLFEIIKSANSLGVEIKQ